MTLTVYLSYFCCKQKYLFVFTEFKTGMKLFAKTVRLRDAKFGYIIELYVYLCKKKFQKD